MVRLGIGMAKLGDLGEKNLIENVISKYLDKPGYGEYLKYPDDTRDIIPIAPRILFSIDGYSINKVRLPWRNLRDIGWTAVIGAISDHIAKGGVPRDIMVSLGLSKNTFVNDLVEIMEGIREAVDKYSLRLLGGDLNESETPWIDVAVIGYTSAKKPPGRCCMQGGDKIIVTGIYGGMGYVVLEGVKKASSMEWVVENTRRPRVYIEVGIVISSYYRSIHASMDVSDGLGYTLLEIARISGKGVVLENLPVYRRELEEICSSKECIWRYVLNGGEEYGVVIVVNNKWVNEVFDMLKKYGVPASVIGSVVDKPPHLYLDNKVFDDKIVFWDQFKGWT